MAARKTAAEESKAPEPLVVDGIDVSVARGRVEDWDFVEAMADLVGSEGVESMPAIVRYMRALFGDEFGRIKAELRARNGGSLGVDEMNEFAMAVVEAAGAKN